jgi:type I restriction-modification system DNA methylase subunit
VTGCCSIRVFSWRKAKPQSSGALLKNKGDMSNNLKRDVRPQLKEFAGLFDSMRYRIDTYQCWSDFLEVALCALSMKTEEKRYLEVIGRYQKKEQQLFPQLFAEMMKAYQTIGPGEWEDFLGEFHEAVVAPSSKSARGQFFTPKHLCDLMTELQPAPNKRDSVNDPACGSGRCLLSLAAQYPDKRLKLVGADIDRNACLMTCINLLLHGFQATVYHMDTLSLKTWDQWSVNPYLYIANVPGVVRPGKHQLFIDTAFNKAA